MLLLRKCTKTYTFYGKTAKRIGPRLVRLVVSLKKEKLFFLSRKRQVAQVAAWGGHIHLSCATSATTSASSGQFGAGLEPVLACLGLSLACPGPVLNILQLDLAYLGLEVSGLNDTNVNDHWKR